ncbi:hypothetical protein BCR44DRAFT_1439114, partial [Catenaria anguillulae PL171]
MNGSPGKLPWPWNEFPDVPDLSNNWVWAGRNARPRQIGRIELARRQRHAHEVPRL